MQLLLVLVLKDIGCIVVGEARAAGEVLGLLVGNLAQMGSLMSASGRVSSVIMVFGRGGVVILEVDRVYFRNKRGYIQRSVTSTTWKGR